MSMSLMFSMSLLLTMTGIIFIQNSLWLFMTMLINIIFITVLVFVSMKGLLSVLCFLMYVSGLMVFFCYFVVMSTIYSSKSQLYFICMVLILYLFNNSVFVSSDNLVLLSFLFLGYNSKLYYSMSVLMILLIQFFVFSSLTSMTPFRKDK